MSQDTRDNINRRCCVQCDHGGAGSLDYGTLMDYQTGLPIGPATAAQSQYAPSIGHLDTGAFTVDGDGNPCPDDANPAVFGPLRTVYISGGPE